MSRREGFTEADYAAPLDAASLCSSAACPCWFGTTEHPTSPRPWPSSSRPVLPDRLSASDVRPRTQLNPAGVVASEVVVGEPDQAHHRRVHRADKDRPETDAVAPRAPGWVASPAPISSSDRSCNTQPYRSSTCRDAVNL